MFLATCTDSSSPLCAPLQGLGKGRSKAGDDGGATKKQHVGLPTRWKLGVFWSEVTADSLGVGFAFGGVEPGRLHAKGKVRMHTPMHASAAIWPAAFAERIM